MHGRGEKKRIASVAAASTATFISTGRSAVNFAVIDTNNFIRYIASIRFGDILVNWLLLVVSPALCSCGCFRDDQITRHIFLFKLKGNPQVILLATRSTRTTSFFHRTESLAVLHSPDHGLHWFTFADHAYSTVRDAKQTGEPSSSLAACQAHVAIEIWGPTLGWTRHRVLDGVDGDAF